MSSSTLKVKNNIKKCNYMHEKWRISDISNVPNLAGLVIFSAHHVNSTII